MAEQQLLTRRSMAAGPMDARESIRTVRIFVSSPGDVAEERVKAREIFERLAGEFSGVLEVAPYFWEHEPMLAHTDFQSQIDPPSKFDLFVCLLWARLGTRLHPGIHRKPDGSEYSSGTEWEILDALAAFKKSRAPQVLIYRRTGVPVIPVKPKDERERVLSQYDALESFVTQLTERDGTFVVATNTYKGLDQFESKFEGDMRQKLREYLPVGVAGSRSVAKTWKTGSPFRGLRFFDFEHAPIFFGRTRETGEVIDALRRQAAEERAFVLVFGGSGVGKSSLARAGVLPLMVKPGVIDGVALWRRAILRPSELNEGDLFDALALAFWQKDALPELGSDGTTVTQVAKMLREAPAGVGMLIKGVLSQAARDAQLQNALERQPRALCALVVDQLEELFTVERLSNQREDFLRAIDALARSGYVWIVATLRSDFYQRCEAFPLLMELKKGAGEYHLPPPDKVQLGQMIRLPAAAAGLLFEEDHGAARPLNDVLRNARLDDVLRDAALASPSSLPLLEFALEELYLNLDAERGLLLLAAYEKMGGVEGALGKRAEESFGKTGAAAQESFNRVFRKLVTINADERRTAVRRRASEDEIVTDAASRALVDQLVADRLLVADRAVAEGTTESVVVIGVAHEAMLDSWERLKDWIAEHRELLKCHAEVTTDTQRWIENHRNDDYLYTNDLPLNRARGALEADFLSKEEQDFVRASLRHVASQQFRSSLEAGKPDRMKAMSDKLRATYPDLREELLQAALASETEATRAHAAALLGLESANQMTPRLVPLLLEDRSEDVRRAAAAGLIRVDGAPYFDELFGRLNGGASSGLTRALSHLRVAADAVKEPTSFEPRFLALSAWLRWRIMTWGWAMRLKRGWPTLIVILIPTLILSSSTAGAFKFFPGLLNYALAQPRAGGAPAIFQGILASFLWGGFITLGITIHGLVFGKAGGTTSLLRPWGSWAAGAIGGMISSALILAVCIVVSSRASVEANGWTDCKEMTEDLQAGLEGASPTPSGPPCDFAGDIFWRRRFFWPYMIMGIGLGTGMGLMTNALRASRRWRTFLHEQSSLTGATATWSLIRSLARLLVRFSWPIPVCLLVADLIAFLVLRTAPVRGPTLLDTWHWKLLGGLDWAKRDPITWPPHIWDPRAWKISPWGEGLSIAFDSITQAIGGFFCIVGMGLGIVAIRYGVKIDPEERRS